MSSDKKYRRELEAELENLTRELAQVRAEKLQQKQRIDQLHAEQTQLRQQLGDSNRNKSAEISLRQKKAERDRVRQELSVSRQQYHKLKHGIGLLKGETGSDGDSSDGSLQDDLNGMAATSQDFIQNLWGSSKDANGKISEDSVDKLAGAFDSNAGFGDLLKDGGKIPQEFAAFTEDMDNDTVITEQTRDSLQIHKARKNKRGGKKSDAMSVGTEDDDTVITEQTKDSLQIHRARASNPNKPSTGLGNFLDSGGKDKPSRANGSDRPGRGTRLGDHFERQRYRGDDDDDDEDKDMQSANE